MSRTYRRQGRPCEAIEYTYRQNAYLNSKYLRWLWVGRSYCYDIPEDESYGVAKRRAIAEYTRDTRKIHTFNGPRDFLNKVERMFRARNRVLTQRLSRDPEYEHDIVSKPKLPYWD